MEQSRDRKRGKIGNCRRYPPKTPITSPEWKRPQAPVAPSAPTHPPQYSGPRTRSPAQKATLSSDGRSVNLAGCTRFTFRSVVLIAVTVPGSSAAAGRGSEGRRGGGRRQVLFGSETNQLRAPRRPSPTVQTPDLSHLGRHRFGQTSTFPHTPVLPSLSSNPASISSNPLSLNSGRHRPGLLPLPG